MKKLVFDLKNIFGVFLTRIKLATSNKEEITRKCCSAALMCFLFLLSGYPILFLSDDTFFKTLFYLIAFIFSAVVLFLFFPISNLKTKKIIKENIFSTVFLLIIGFSAILSLIINREINSFMLYAGFGLVVLNAYIISKLISLRKFVSMFSDIMYFICIISILFYAVFLCFGRNNFSLLQPFETKNDIYYNFYYLSFISSKTGRMQGVFWEPGLFASYIILALCFEIIFNDKNNLIKIIVFVVCLLLTQSTFAIIVSLLIVPIVLNKKIKKEKIKIILIILFFALIIVSCVFFQNIMNVLSNIMPNIFGKFIPGSPSYTSLSTRLVSPYINLLIFIKHPFVGAGMSGAGNEYAAYLADPYWGLFLDAQTSTSTQLISQFGILGIVFTIFPVIAIIKSKELNEIEKICFGIIVLLIINKEPHNYLLLTWTFIFLLIQKNIDKHEYSLISKKASDDSNIHIMSGNSNEAVVKRNVFSSLLIKAASIIIGFFTIPAYLHFFASKNDVVGVWLTIVSILSWIITFDLGLGNGLKNKLIEAIEEKDEIRIKKLISSAYISTFVIVVFFFISGIVLINLIDVNAVFGIGKEVISEGTLTSVAIIVLSSICLEFLLKNVIYILQALQKQAFASIFSLITAISTIAFAYLLMFNGAKTQLISMAYLHLIATNIPLAIGTIIVFAKFLKRTKPSIKSFDWKACKEVMSLGFGFFIIQISLLLINSSNDILISSIYGAENTTLYTEYSKIFLMITSVFSMITLPYWSMITKMRKNGNLFFINKLVKKLVIFLISFSGILLIGFLLLQPFITIWLGADAFEVNHLIGFVIFTYSLTLIFVSFSTTIANGLSNIKVQLICLLISAVAKIIVCIVVSPFVKDNIGWPFIIIVNCSVLFPSSIIIFIDSMKQLRKIKLQSKNAPQIIEDGTLKEN